jgi:hypothetical protein
MSPTSNLSSKEIHSVRRSSRSLLALLATLKLTSRDRPTTNLALLCTTPELVVMFLWSLLPVITQSRKSLTTFTLMRALFVRMKNSAKLLLREEFFLRKDRPKKSSPS